VNPFAHRFHATAAELIDREEELALLARRMAEGGRVRLAAPRGYGKTTLAEAALAHAREKGALAVRVDLYGVTSRMTLCSRIEEAFERELSGADGTWAKAKAKLARRGGGMQLPRDSPARNSAPRTQSVACSTHSTSLVNWPPRGQWSSVTTSFRRCCALAVPSATAAAGHGPGAWMR
jgi:hypothetical protein